MKRYILLQLLSETDYDAKHRIVLLFEDRHPDTNIAFSANIGQYGGFITDYENTFLLWQEWITENL